MAPTMREEVTVTVRVPKDGLAEELRARHGIKADLFDITLDDDALVLSFRNGPGEAASSANGEKAAPAADGGGASAKPEDVPNAELDEENWEEKARAQWSK